MKTNNSAEENMTVTPWVLYVGKSQKESDFSHGSALCMRIIEANNLQRFVVVQDCNSLRARGVEFPDWLRGVPTLIERSTMTSFAGSEAVIKLATVGAQVASHIANMQTRATEQHASSLPESKSPTPSENTNRVSARRALVEEMRNDHEESAVADVEDDPLHVGDIVSTPPSEETSTRRVTEDDMNKYLAERKRMDAAIRERQQSAPPRDA